MKKLITQVQAFVVAVITVGVLVVSPSIAQAGTANACGIATQTGDIKVNITSNQWIFSTGPETGLHRPSLTASAAIPKGSYKIILEAQDFSDGRDKQTQPKEYYHVQLKNGSTVVATTGRTQDLKDFVTHATWRGTVNEKLVVGSAVTSVKAIHSAYVDSSNPNSVMPRCMVLRPVDVAPSIDIIKRDAKDKDDTQAVPYGGNANFEIVVKNNGKANLKNVTVTDPVTTSCAKSIGALAKGQSKTYTCTSTNVKKDFTNIAYAVGNSVITNQQVKDNDPTKVTVVIPNPSIDIIKRDAVDKDDTQAVKYGGTAKFEIIVKNTGKVNLKNVVVTDPVTQSCVNTIGTLNTGATKTYTCTSTNVKKDFTNIAYVVGNSVITNQQVKDNDPTKVTVVIPNPSIDIIKRDAVDKDDTQEVKQGETAKFEIIVKNTGKVNLKNVVVTDPVTSSCVNTIGTLAVNASKTYTCDSKDVQKDFTNIAYVTGKSVITGQEVKDNDPSKVVVLIPGTPSIDIIKRDAADKDDTQDVKQGEVAKFEIIVRNDGEVNLKNVVVTDPITTSCAKDVGILKVGEKTVFTCDSKDVQKDFTNIAYVVGNSTETNQKVEDKDPTHVTVIIPGTPSIDIIKRDASDKDDTQEVKQGEAAKFEIIVKNNGEANLKNVVVTDPITTSCEKEVGTLKSGEDTSFTCESKDVQKDFTNIAYVVGNSTETGEKVEDKDPTDVTVIIPGTPSIDIIKRDAKDGDDTQSVKKGGTAKFEIIVKNSGAVALKDVLVTDPLVKACEKSIGSLDVKESKTYTCEHTNVTAAYTNTAHTEGSSVETSKKVKDSDPSKVVVDAPEPEPEPEPEEPKKKKKCNSSIGNTVWYDNNGNGVQDDGEEGIDDVTMKLIDGNDVVKDKTNSSGKYKFDDLCKGTYTVVVHADHIPDGCYQTADPDSKLDHTTKVKLGNGDDHTKADFGYRCPAGNVAPSTGPGAAVASISAGLASSLLVAYKLFVHGRITRRPEEDGIMGTIIE